jgi:hypothetical protein
LALLVPPKKRSGPDERAAAVRTVPIHLFRATTG